MQTVNFLQQLYEYTDTLATALGSDSIETTLGICREEMEMAMDMELWMSSVDVLLV